MLKRIETSVLHNHDLLALSLVAPDTTITFLKARRFLLIRSTVAGQLGKYGEYRKLGLYDDDSSALESKTYFAGHWKNANISRFVKKSFRHSFFPF